MSIYQNVPLVNLSSQNHLIRNEFLNEIIEILETNEFLLGSRLTTFEESYADFIGSVGVVGVGNGTDALEIALRVLKLDSSQKITIPANTFAATAFAAQRAGYDIEFCDVDMSTGNISVGNLKELRKKPEVLLAVSLYGRSLGLDVYKWALDNEILIIEDGSQSQGARIDGINTITLASIGTTSFYPTKNLGSFGDAGAVIVNNPEHMSRALKIRNYGGKAKYEHTTFGFNSRMSEIQASVLNLKLKYLNQWTSERIDIAQKYYNLLKDNPNIYLPKLNFDGSNVFHLFPILVEDRDKIKLKMKESGVDLGIHYPQILPETQAFYKYNYAKSNLKSAKSWADKNITLPIYPGLPDSSIDYVVENLQKNLKN